ncbi:zinc-binding alcohol dehydrogenase family protein [Variovorax sp. YR216]|uniref:zinc-binding alcohol dehydrogenase family protein n=1 Tax=Variovorax sp. YR216 TaxID=1882828 RepID=UPI000895F6B3|nr:zinc-binding alcohol dehydrogenase family protein [Variovorax sp. YR216]SEB05106.1 zinc-binding alcohol dehydrogenase family protein [Variovorax sp. YR216]
MKAVGYRQSLPIDDPASLEDLELPEPTPAARDLLVRVKAISVNPVDTKVRKNAAPEAGQVKVLGWDAVGIVEAVGPQVGGFRPGDRVYYAGSVIRPGANSELHAVDERIAALAPRTLDDAQAAALPLTTITAYELLFDRLGVAKGGGAGQTLLVTGGAGGVGSILIQLARQLTQLRVIATASRPETRDWCLSLGAHAVIDHSRPLAAELKAAGIGQVDRVASLTQTQQHYAQIIEALKPQGQLAVIDDMPVLDAMPLKTKSISLHWEMMFARSRFETPDMPRQGELLAEVAALVDAGRIRTTANASFGAINAANLRRAHALIESGRAQGKVVLEGF